jgi:diketogulonate reductase-like aldo/keto reductase
MVTKKFGWTGVEVPVIGQGTWMMEGNRKAEERAIEALRSGLDLSLTFIDTAEMYGNGHVEELVGEAIAGRRDEAFLVSKVLPSNASYKGTLRACEQSLKRLKSEWLDLYLLHWPGGHPIGETMRAMEELVEAQKIRFIGISNFDVEEVQEAQRALRKQRLACNQVLYHLHDRGIERRLIPYCAQNEIAVIGYSPFGHGSFPSAGSKEAKLLAGIGRRHRRTARQVALNFLTRHPFVFSIPKAANVDHVKENSGGAGWTLRDDDIGRIDAAFPAPARETPLGIL